MNRITALWQSTIGKKVAMALTGVIMILFLVSHTISNDLIFVNPHHLDSYGAWLRSFGPLLWLARAGLLITVLVHIAAAYQLTVAARRARPVGYLRHELQVASYGSRTMRWGGVLLAVFIVFHLLHFTTGTFLPGWREGEVGANVKLGFQSVPVALFYILAMLALGLHLSHGVWSAFQTIGLNHPAYNGLRRGIAWFLAIAIAGGLILIPVGALLGWLT